MRSIDETIDHLLAEARRHLLEAADGVQEKRLVTAKTLARSRTTPVEVKESMPVPVAGIEHAYIQMWRGDRGKIISDDGNNVTVMLAHSGLVRVPKRDFDRLFDSISSEDLALSDTDPEERIF